MYQVYERPEVYDVKEKRDTENVMTRRGSFQLQDCYHVLWETLDQESRQVNGKERAIDYGLLFKPP